MIKHLLLLLGFCSHEHTYREFRDVQGQPRLHFVCESCLKAFPVDGSLRGVK